MSCVFCEIVDGKADATVVPTRGAVSLAIVPLGPVVAGHLLFIPRRHITDAADDPWLTGQVMQDAANWGRLVGEPFNLIASAGREATQSVFHLHIHYVPRSADDGLMLPWGTLYGENPQDPHRCKGMIALESKLGGA